MAITVENGSGLTDSDSYVSVADADAYIGTYMRNSSDWSGSSTAAREGYLKEATQILDVLYARRWAGTRLKELQALAFPREGAYDHDGYTFDATIVPLKVKHATVELAWRALQVGGEDTTTGDSTKLVPDTAVGGNISSEEVAAGSVRSKTTYVGGKTGTKYYKKVEMLLTGYVRPRGAIERA